MYLFELNEKILYTKKDSDLIFILLYIIYFFISHIADWINDFQKPKPVAYIL